MRPSVGIKPLAAFAGAAGVKVDGTDERLALAEAEVLAWLDTAELLAGLDTAELLGMEATEEAVLTTELRAVGMGLAALEAIEETTLLDAAEDATELMSGELDEAIARLDALATTKLPDEMADAVVSAVVSAVIDAGDVDETVTVSVVLAAKTLLVLTEVVDSKVPVVVSVIVTVSVIVVAKVSADVVVSAEVPNDVVSKAVLLVVTEAVSAVASAVDVPVASSVDVPVVSTVVVTPIVSIVVVTPVVSVVSAVFVTEAVVPGTAPGQSL